MRPTSDRATLKAILFADLQQYALRVAADEVSTLAFVSSCFKLFQDRCEAFDAEFVKTTGDGVLILFDGASSAIEYAMDVQQRLGALARDEPDSGRFRIGLHMGEVYRRDGDVFGHAVNLAARVQGKAEPGGVCVTQDIYWAARATSRFTFRYVGRPALKHMLEPVSLYHVTTGDGPAAGRRLAISVIDGFSLLDGDGDYMHLRSREAQAIVGYLALSSQYQSHQDRMATLLWPGNDIAHARRTLAARLQTIDRASERGEARWLIRRGGQIALNPELVSVDLVRILEGLGEGKVDDLLLHRSDYIESILAGLENVSGLFAAWLKVVRHNLREDFVEALEALLDRFTPAEAASRRAANALLLLEPSHERAGRALIRHYLASGNVSSALRVYEALKSVLRERFQITPGAETTNLVQEYSAGLALVDNRSASPPAKVRAPHIAIGKFVAQSEDLEFTAFGFRSELIVNISKMRDWIVIENDDSHAIKDVEYALTAVCSGTRQQIRLHVALIVPATGRIVWSDSFDLSLDGWAMAQKRLVANVAAALEVYVSQDRLSRILQVPAHDLEAYDAWLRGEHMLTQWTAEAEDEAERLFERVIEDDPGFAPAHASLASIYNSTHFIRPGTVLGKDSALRSLALAGRAVEIDPLDARNHLVMAWSTAMMSRFDQSEVHYGLAADLTPNSPKTLVSAALGLAFMGRVDRAKVLLDQATALSRSFLDYQWCHIATIRYFAGDMEGVLEAADRSNNLIVDTPGWKAAALLRLGRDDEARAALGELQMSVAEIWKGPRQATAIDVIRWFLSAFPIKNPKEKAHLSRLLEIGAAHA